MSAHTGLVSRRRQHTGARMLLPAGLLAGATGAAGAENPLIGAGMAGMTIASLLPWVALFTALTGAAIGNRWGIEISGVSLRAAQALMVPFALRTILLIPSELRPRWRLTEWLLAGFVAVNFLSTYFYARQLAGHRGSELGALIELLGVITYLMVYQSMCTPERLRKAARIFLFLGAAGAVIGIVSFIGYYVGFGFGVDFRYVPAFNGAPAIKGIAYEHDIFGSTCAGVAIAFLVLMRENGTLFTRKWTSRLFWISVAGMILSQSRGAWIGFLLVFLGYYVVSIRRRRMVRTVRMLRTTGILLMCGVIGLAALYFTNTQSSTSPPSPITGLVVTGAQKIASAVQLSGTASCDGCNTGAGRLRRWTKGVNEVMATSPVIGLGTDSYGLRNFRPSPFTWPYLAPAYIESLYVRTFYDTGALGLLLFLLFLGFLLWPRKELQQAMGEPAMVSRALTFGGIALAIAYAVTDSTLLIWPWIAFGLIRAANELALREARRDRAAGGNWDPPAGAHRASPLQAAERIIPIRGGPPLTGTSGLPSVAPGGQAIGNGHRGEDGNRSEAGIWT